MFTQVTQEEMRTEELGTVIIKKEPRNDCLYHPENINR